MLAPVPGQTIPMGAKIQIKKAGKALQTTKQQGRNRFAIYKESN